MKGGCLITNKFVNLEGGKKTRILNAALEEFAEHGYEKASTNRIVKNAGIGKGMLFYYFNNKRELYEDLISYSTNFAKTEYLDKIIGTQMDFIEKCRSVAHIKFQAYEKSSYVFKFLATCYRNRESDTKSESILENMKHLKELSYEKIYKSVDMSLFRDDIEPEMVYKMIRWTMDGYEKELMKKVEEMSCFPSESIKDYWDDFYEYLDVLKKVYYKKGGKG